MAEANESLVVRENRIRCAGLGRGVQPGVVGVDRQPWSPVVKPAFGPASHCMGVRALSRLILARPASAAPSSRPSSSTLL